MKRKIITSAIFVALTAFLLNFYNVIQAYSGEIDPNNYISLPSSIFVKNKVGTGTVSLATGANGYTLSYQKVDITLATFDNLDAKLDQINQYIKNANTEIEKKSTDIKNLQEEYKKLQENETTTQEELTTAKKKYDDAYTEYKNYKNTVEEKIKTMKNEYYALVPNYTNSWKKATNTTNNVELDFKDYTGKTSFILWVKIENGTNTYYDLAAYSSEIKEEPKKEEEQPTKDTTPTDEQLDEEWTDFSNAKYELVRQGYVGVGLEISGVNHKEDSRYYLYITSSKDKPDITNLDYSEKTKIDVIYNEEKNKLISGNPDAIAEKVELNQELYATIIEKRNGKENVVTYGNKLNRFAEPQYSDAFSATFVSNSIDQIITNFTHSGKNSRKIEIKVGKVTDINILKKIKNQDSTGFSELLKFAKSSSGIYNQKLNSNGSSRIGYESGDKNTIIDLKSLEDEQYYFLYVKTDDENGKYISNEAVTLGQATVITDSDYWSIFPYDSDDFKWADFGDAVNGESDDTKSPDILPFAGNETIILATIGIVLASIGISSYYKYKKYKGIYGGK